MASPLARSTRSTSCVVAKRTLPLIAFALLLVLMAPPSDALGSSGAPTISPDKAGTSESANAAGSGTAEQPSDAPESAQQPDAGSNMDVLSATTTWADDTPFSDCATCHTSGASGSDTGDLITVPAHASLDCAVCHSDQDTLLSIHESKATSKAAPKQAARLKKLKTTTVSSDVCLTCHDKTDLVQATSAYTDLVDSNGTVVNPHDIPSNETHDQTTCADCHKFHWDSEPGEQAGKYCFGCHHAGVFECHTCHD